MGAIQIVFAFHGLVSSQISILLIKPTRNKYVHVCTPCACYKCIPILRCAPVLNNVPLPDLRFPLDGAVELHFSPTPEVRLPSPAPTPAVTVDHSDDPVTRWDSYENLSLAESPLDGDTDMEDTVGKSIHFPLPTYLHRCLLK